MLKSVEGRRFGSSEGRARADPQALALPLGTAPSLTTDLGAMVLQGADMLVTSQPQTFTNRRPGSPAPQATPASAAVNVSGSMEPPSLRATEPSSQDQRPHPHRNSLASAPPPKELHARALCGRMGKLCSSWKSKSAIFTGYDLLLLLLFACKSSCFEEATI